MKRVLEWLWPRRGSRLSCSTCLWRRDGVAGQVVCGHFMLADREPVVMERRMMVTSWFWQIACGPQGRWHRDAAGYNLSWTRFGRTMLVVNFLGIGVMWSGAPAWGLVVIGLAGVAPLGTLLITKLAKRK